MRDCNAQGPVRSSATDDPCLNGIAHDLADLYEPVVRETPPDRLRKLAEDLAKRLRAETRKGED
ncbi:hypothetical protein [Methylobacterium nigriterrae]|uniref:hypothetical protein n=1 Tax=Methylobacterium nigriterrae TaxID=3127512 RepID=UPI003013B874